jgi:quinol monooxygenase YgiN
MGELVGIARFDFRDGDVEEFKRISAQCMEIVRAKEPGTLEYAVYFNADESEAIVVERYRDEDAAKVHSENISQFMDAVIATGSVHGELLGDVSDELRANLEGGPVQLFTPYMSM